VHLSEYSTRLRCLLVVRAELAVVVLLCGVACSRPSSERLRPDPACAIPSSGARRETPPTCLEGGGSPTSELDLRAIDALRRGDAEALKVLGVPKLDVVAAIQLASSLSDQHPYRGCNSAASGIVSSYGGMDGGIHDLRLEWAWRDRHFQLEHVSKFGW
jgi:hypothetical protein